MARICGEAERLAVISQFELGQPETESDHFPIWVQIDTDIDGQRLMQIVQNAKK